MRSTLYARLSVARSAMSVWRNRTGINKRPPRFRALCAVLALICVLLITDEAIGIPQDLLDTVQRKYGKRAIKILMQWQELVNKNGASSDEEKLRAVNRFFNRKIRFITDKRHWGKKDYWATPLETMGTRGGDCEDFSIAKYFTLLEMGVPDKRMRITYVRAKRINQAHMVLTYYPSPGAEPLVLDNLTDRIRPASKRKDLKPVYSFNGSSLWMSKERGGGRVGSSGNIGLWRELQARHNNSWKH